MCQRHRSRFIPFAGRRGKSYLAYGYDSGLRNPCLLLDTFSDRHPGPQVRAQDDPPAVSALALREAVSRRYLVGLILLAGGNFSMLAH